MSLCAWVRCTAKFALYALNSIEDNQKATTYKNRFRPIGNWNAMLIVLAFRLCSKLLHFGLLSNKEHFFYSQPHLMFTDVSFGWWKIETKPKCKWLKTRDRREKPNKLHETHEIPIFEHKKNKKQNKTHNSRKSQVAINSSWVNSSYLCALIH